MNKSRIFGLTVGTFFYCFGELYFASLILYNVLDNFNLIMKSFSESALAENFLEITDNIIFTFYFSIVAILFGCILLNVMYRRDKKRCLIIDSSVLIFVALYIYLAYIEPIFEVSYSTFLKSNTYEYICMVLLMIVAFLSIVEIVYAVYAFVKTVRKRKPNNA